MTMIQISGRTTCLSSKPTVSMCETVGKFMFLKIVDPYNAAAKIILTIDMEKNATKICGRTSYLDSRPDVTYCERIENTFYVRIDDCRNLAVWLTLTIHQ